MKIVDECLEKTLEELAENNANGFPADHSKRSYYDRYHSLSEKLHSDFHNQVVAGSMAVDGGVLTDHGSEHIKTVIQRAGRLLDHNETHPGNELTPYEIYILLTAIHFHDIGNIMGRTGHEKRIGDMMKAVDSHLGDETEKKCIKNIATVHGGNIDGDKDTISYLNMRDAINGKYVRPQLLAAILRFADELADDSLRANRVLQQLGIIPKESQVYHKYASCLHSVMVSSKEKLVELHFDVHVRDLTKTFGKKVGVRTKQVYLIDEILDRTLKAHLERTYCNRHMSPVVDIRKISVTIALSKENELPGQQLPKIAFRLEESGYPNMTVRKVYKACSELRDWEGTTGNLTGQTMNKWANKNLAATDKEGSDIAKSF